MGGANGYGHMGVVVGHGRVELPGAMVSVGLLMVLMPNDCQS